MKFASDSPQFSYVELTLIYNFLKYENFYIFTILLIPT
ncbi:hypothetical protein LEP1GSC073_3131 [Leptospira noguchii str. Cascata]|nr:hypothetical protein LEP1GSC170_1412 [Leptospira interrogans serovar Bataviae str. HAI135]EMS82323.1 hypothetical protein LEP1GSC073_3131 [Leptospira noguchii str. Cascata]